MIGALAPPPAVDYVDQLCDKLQVDQPAVGVPAGVLGLDAAARDAMADARAALADYRYADAATAAGKVLIAAKSIRDIFDTGFAAVGAVGASMSLTLACSSRWTQIATALQSAIRSKRGF